MTYFLDVAKGFHITLRQMSLNSLKFISVQLGTWDRHKTVLYKSFWV